MKAKLTDLVFDFELYPRNDISQSHVTALCNAIERGDELPPIIVERKSMRVVDGFHRGKAYKRLKIENVEVEARAYKSDADLYADAVRRNIGHGRAFDPFDRRRAVLRLQEFGFQRAEISEIIRIPAAKLGAIVQQTATRSGRIVILKHGLIRELQGRTLTKGQALANDQWSGYQPAYHVHQLVRLLEAGISPITPAFIEGMDRLCELWAAAKKQKVSA